MISEPTPVISSMKLADSGSSRIPMLTWKPPTGMYENRCRSWLRSRSPSSAKKAITP